MSSTTPRGRTALARVATLAVATAGLAVLASPTKAVAAADPSAAAQRSTSNVNGATFTWGLSGYAQKGIFGPWTYQDLTGSASQLVGSVSGGDQTEYVVEPVPATSMPASDPQKSANAIRFVGGTGTADPATGAATLSWTGSYTVNAYPASFNAPDEIYSDPQLTISAAGVGTLTMDLTIGAGVAMDGTPTPPVDLGRLPVMTYTAGSASKVGDVSYRYTPDYQGNEVTVASGSPQVTSCTTDAGATGWWGAWPDELVNAVPDSIRPHFYSTGCAGMNDNKPALPLDVTFDSYGSVQVSKTTLLPHGTQQVTVTGSGFDPELAIGTRPPFQGSQSGVYIAFGRYADVWKPTQNAPSSSRTNPPGANGTGVAVKWAVPAASFPGPFNQDPTSPAYTTLGTDGTFSTTISIDQSWLSSASGNFGIYTYAGGGPTVASYETFTPITFARATPTVSVEAADTTYGEAGSAVVTVASEGGTTGDVTLSLDGTQIGDPVALVDGAATFTLPADLTAGDHDLSVDYTGNDNTEAATVTGTAHVDGLASTVELSAPQRTFGQKSAVAVSVTTTGSDAGSVTLKRGATTVGTLDLFEGQAIFDLGRLGAGTYPLTATFSGNSSTAASAGDGSVKVVKATTTTKPVVTTKPTTKKAGKVKVTVTSPTTTPTGEVTLKIKQGSKVLKSVTLTLKGGVASTGLPKGAAGGYSVVTTYAGTADITRSSRTVAYTVR